MPADMFKSMTPDSIGQRQNYKATRLENHGSKEPVCGRITPWTLDRSRGFSARYHKSIASDSGISVNRVGVERRRASLEDINEY